VNKVGQVKVFPPVNLQRQKKKKPADPRRNARATEQVNDPFEIFIHGEKNPTGGPLLSSSRRIFQSQNCASLSIKVDFFSDGVFFMTEREDQRKTKQSRSRIVLGTESNYRSKICQPNRREKTGRATFFEDANVVDQHQRHAIRTTAPKSRINKT
jgi:hypothetical protein